MCYNKNILERKFVVVVWVRNEIKEVFMEYIYSISYKGEKIELTDELNSKILEILSLENTKQSPEEELNWEVV